MRWQPVQWQASASSGGALTRNRVWPQRQPPSQGSFQSVIALLLAAIQTDSLRFGETRLLMSMTAVCSAGYLREIGRATSRESMCKSGYISAVAVTFKKK